MMQEVKNKNFKKNRYNSKEINSNKVFNFFIIIFFSFYEDK